MVAWAQKSRGYTQKSRDYLNSTKKCATAAIQMTMGKSQIGAIVDFFSEPPGGRHGLFFALGLLFPKFRKPPSKNTRTQGLPGLNQKVRDSRNSDRPWESHR